VVADALEWTERAGAVAAYREAHGYRSETDPIGPAPLPHAVEARASWQRAYEALGRPEAQREMAGANDAELRSMVEHYRREEAWAPRHVDSELREQSLSLDYWRSKVEIDRAEAEREAGGKALRAEVAEQLHNDRAAMHYQEAQVAALVEISASRSAWYEETRESRDRAIAARRELQAREAKDQEPESVQAATPEQVKNRNVVIFYDPPTDVLRPERPEPEPPERVPDEATSGPVSEREQARHERSEAGRQPQTEPPTGGPKPEPVAPQAAELARMKADLEKARQARAIIEGRQEAEKAQAHERGDYEHLQAERAERDELEVAHPLYDAGDEGSWY
jgi:hypothetical protein